MLNHEIINITPATAKQWLDASEFNNRKLREAYDYKVSDFLDQLESGHSLEEDSPILALRNALIIGDMREGGHNGDVAIAKRVAFTIKAWNASIKGTSIKRLRITLGQEAYPAVL